MEETWRRRRREGKEATSSSHFFTEECEYDVLLSYGGTVEFVVLPFVDFLYRKLKDAGLQVYLLDIEKEKDTQWSLAITNCRISIPIIHEYFASSRICLDHAVMIAECMRTRGLLVLPIFYKIDRSHVQNQTGPFEKSHVRNQTGPFEKYFRKYQHISYSHYTEMMRHTVFAIATSLALYDFRWVTGITYLIMRIVSHVILKGDDIDRQVINKWKEALREIGSLRGFIIAKDAKNYKRLDRIVEQVKNQLMNCEVPADDNLMGKSNTTAHGRTEEIWRQVGRVDTQSSYPSSPFTIAKTFQYDVFLSCRGDTRNSFTSFLYMELEDAGLQVYLDDKEPQAGEDYHPGLMEAIEKSRLLIPIFSPDYALSKSCLHEVAKMYDCCRKIGRIILPVFYNIEPCDIQNQTGPFERSFHEHQEKRHDSQILDKWKQALRWIGFLKGYPVRGNQGGLVKRIVSEVSRLLKTHNVPLDDNYLVGIDQPMQKVVEMLQISSRNVVIVGICGIRGIGKTTLAKALYHELVSKYEHCCFISSIQERSEKNGLPSLQIKLIEELLQTDHGHFGSFEENLNFIKDRFRHMRVLIVLDDVKCLDHIKAFGVDLQCFGHGSRIIVTTRKPELLVEAKVPHRYFVEELDEQHSLKLFYSHAFGKDSPDEEYSHLSREIASSSRGIPRIIESVGFYLSSYRNKEKQRWENVLQQLRSCQYKPLQELLMLSHDDLSKGPWRFYHDEACFPNGQSNDITHYNVVLSFDARDKVKNLVESLHKRMESVGVGIFALNGYSMEVNNAGKILIPVFSKSYASNSSCLEMLAHMVECRRSSETNHILPIFCAVEPSIVRLQNLSYMSEDDEAVNRWQEALIEVTNISGSSLLQTFRTEEIINLTDSVCQMVLHKLKLNQLSMGKHLVGINHHVGRILELLNLDVNDVRIIAISGEDGSGKTTLAKVVHHQLSSSFEGCSFLTEINERTRHYDGIKYLQAQMIADLLNSECEIFDSVIEGINLIKERFRSMKVLIILDDVTESFHVEALVGQLDWLGPGSRIIIATKNTSIIPLPHFNGEIQLNWGSAFDKSYELFCKSTFRKDSPLPKFKSLSKEIVRLLLKFSNSCLTIEIVGSLLYGKDVAEWECVLQNLQDGEMDLKGVLRMSFDRLDEKQKEIFLDISCFSNGLGRQIASSLWYDSKHSSVSSDIEKLILLSLVKIDANNEILMHGLIKGFGREFVDQKNQQTMGKGKNQHVPLQPSALVFETANMRLFKLDHAIIGGSIDRVFMRRRDLIWKWCPLDLLAMLNSECLNVLDMSWSKITEGWEGWKRIKVPQLRVLNLRGCKELMVTPDFSFCLGLEILILERCVRLVKIDASIGKLRRLTTLSLRYCLELAVLPNEVGCLTALRELTLDKTSLREIPFSIGNLKNLKFLTAINCFSLSYLPNSTRDLRSVTVIKLDFANITELPYFIGEKMKLQHLSLRGCRGIKRLAPLLGAVENSLVELDVSETSISELPKSFAKLKSLRVLKMDFCFIREFPPNFGELKRLEEIHASWCRNLRSLPKDIGELISLRILILRRTCIFNVPESIQYLGCLQTLDCTSCDELENLPKLPSSMTSLHVESKRLKEVPDYSNLTRLQEFTCVSGDLRDLSDVSMAAKSTTDSLYWLQQCFPLRTLRLCRPQIRHLPGLPDSLKLLCLFGSRNLEYMPPLPSTIVVLSIQDCTSLMKMPKVENLNNLQELEILRCPQIQMIEGLERLQAMRVLTISGSGIKSLEGLDKLTSLTRLNISRSLRKFLDLSKLKCENVHWL